MANKKLVIGDRRVDGGGRRRPRSLGLGRCHCGSATTRPAARALGTAARPLDPGRTSAVLSRRPGRLLESQLLGR